MTEGGRVRDPLREWSPSDRSDAGREGDRDGRARYDADFDSGDRAYERWRNGGPFEDPEPGNRFS